MKFLNEFRDIEELLSEQEIDIKKFDILVRAGLADKTKIQRLHRILDKMKEERPVFNPTERRLLQDLFNKMVGLLTDNPQLFQRTRRAVREESEDITTEPIVEDKKEKTGPNDPPFVLILKRKSFRPYPNGMKVALYHSPKLDRYFTVPYSAKGFETPIQAEGTNDINSEVVQESVMDQLHSIVANKQAKSVKFGNGQTRKVDHYTASAMTNVHKALKPENAKKYADLIHKSPAHFMKGSDFAFKAHSKK